MSLISKFYGNMNVTGRIIRKYRMAQKLSYEKLSTKLELKGISIHKQNLYEIEINKRTVKDYELLGIINALGIDINELLEEFHKEQS